MQQRSQKFKRVVVFGNSASGKSSLAKKLVEQEQLAHLDLDRLAWLPTSEEAPTPQRKNITLSVGEINQFISQNNEWVIEGCYSDLLTYALAYCSEIVFLNLPIALCLRNAKNRPWEPHKYQTKAEQDGNLAMLLDWIAQYEKRTDTFSKLAHQKLYDEFVGDKRMLINNQSLIAKQ